MINKNLNINILFYRIISYKTMQIKAISIILILACVSIIQSSNGFGRCKATNPTVMNSLDVNAYMGKWYEQIRDTNVPFQKGECDTAEYTLQEDGLVRVENREYVIETDTPREAIGRAQCRHPDTESVCDVQFGPSFLGFLTKGNYRVVHTDYSNYTVVYSCVEFLFGAYHLEYVWVLTRERNPSTEVMLKAIQVVKNLGYPGSSIRTTNQGENCKYNSADALQTLGN